VLAVAAKQQDLEDMLQVSTRYIQVCYTPCYANISSKCALGYAVYAILAAAAKQLHLEDVGEETLLQQP
jgi:hypothetical protein